MRERDPAWTYGAVRSEAERPLSAAGTNVGYPEPRGGDLASTGMLRGGSAGMG